jgi:hypothetical protein
MDQPDEGASTEDDFGETFLKNATKDWGTKFGGGGGFGGGVH